MLEQNDLQIIRELFKEELQGVKEDIINTKNEINMGFDKMDVKLIIVEERLDTIDGRLGMVDERLDTIDGRFDTVDERLDTIDERLVIVEERLATADKRLATVDERLSTVDKCLDKTDKRLNNIELEVKEFHQMDITIFGELERVHMVLLDKTRVLERKIV